MKLPRLMIVAIASLAFGGTAFACTGGLEWIIDIGLYKADITNDAPFILPTQTVKFDFVLLNDGDPGFASGAIVPYSEARVKITKGSEELFRTTLPYNADRELAGFDFTFPKQTGDYKLSVDFLRSEKSVGMAEITVNVEKSKAVLSGPVLYGVFGGVLSILLIIIVVTKFPVKKV